MKYPFLFGVTPRSLLVSLVLFTSCHSKIKDHDPGLILAPRPPESLQNKDQSQLSRVIAHVNTTEENGTDYALYLPSNYSSAAHLPVIIFFDPHGDGNLPLNKYSALAEAKKFILIGSNTSKNGMSFDAGIQVANSLIREAKQRYHVAENEIALCGFSGGAKVAMLAGAANTDVSSIIYCGAVQPWQSLTHEISLLGFAGLRDMNYSDLVNFSLSPQLLKISHYLIEWQGKHEWPDADVFQYAFVRPFSAIPADQLIETSEIKLSELQEEQTIKQQYIQAFNTKDLDWWRSEIATLNRKKSQQLMNERLLGFISLACYSLGNRALQQNDLPSTEKILSIYRMADPENKDMEIMYKQYQETVSH